MNGIVLPRTPATFKLEPDLPCGDGCRGVTIQSGRRTDRQTARQADKETERQGDKETERQRQIPGHEPDRPPQSTSGTPPRHQRDTNLPLPEPQTFARRTSGAVRVTDPVSYMYLTCKKLGSYM